MALRAHTAPAASRLHSGRGSSRHVRLCVVAALTTGDCIRACCDGSSSAAGGAIEGTAVGHHPHPPAPVLSALPVSRLQGQMGYTAQQQVGQGDGRGVGLSSGGGTGSGRAGGRASKCVGGRVPRQTENVQVDPGERSLLHIRCAHTACSTGGGGLLCCFAGRLWRAGDWRRAGAAAAAGVHLHLWCSAAGAVPAGETNSGRSSHEGVACGSMKMWRAAEAATAGAVVGGGGWVARRCRLPLAAAAAGSAATSLPSPAASGVEAACCPAAGAQRRHDGRGAAASCAAC